MYNTKQMLDIFSCVALHLETTVAKLPLVKADCKTTNGRSHNIPGAMGSLPNIA